MVQIDWTNEAIVWLDSIHGYIATDSPGSAVRVIQGIYDKVQLLRDHPRLGQRYERINDREVREIIYGHYRIAYLVKAEDKIDILGVFHGAMDIDRYLQ